MLGAFLCCKVLFGSLGYMIYVVQKYSEYFNYGGGMFGRLWGRSGLYKGWLFPNRLHDLSDDTWRRFIFLFKIGAPLWYIGAAVLKSQVGYVLGIWSSV